MKNDSNSQSIALRDRVNNPDLSFWVMNRRLSNVIRGALVACGCLAVAVAVTAPVLRRPDGWLDPLAGALAVGGISLTLLGAVWDTRWQRCVFLLVVAIVGQACVLQLVDVRPPGAVVYDLHFPVSYFLTSFRGLFLLGLLAQTVIVFLAARRIWFTIKEYLSRYRLWQFAILLLFLIFSGVKFTLQLTHYGFDVVLLVWISSVSVLNLILVAAAVPRESLENTARVLKRLLSSRALPWLIAGWVTGVAALVTWFVLEGVPHIPDDVSYLFQAKYFATGHLYLPAPPDKPSFEIGQVVNDGTKWYAYGFPGWPAILALGVLAGAPWLVNPILAGLAVLLTYALVCRLYDRSTAGAAVLLLGGSPWFLFMSASLMAHAATVVWALLASLAVERGRQSGRGIWGVLAGFCLGVLFLTRPLEGVIVGLALGIWALGVGGFRVAPRVLIGLIVGSLLVGGLIFPYCYALTGSATYTPHMKWTHDNWAPGTDRLGFGPGIGGLKGWEHLDPFPGHGPLDVLINANFNFYLIQSDLFGWSFGSLAFVVLALFLSGTRKADWFFLTIIFLVIFAHSFYWFSGGPDFGARYWYQTLVPFVVLTARGIQIVQRRLIEHGVTKPAAARVTPFVIAACIVAFVNVMPWRSLGKYPRYRNYSAEVDRLAHAYHFGQSLVFLPPNDYQLAFAFNPPTLDAGGTIYAADAGPVHRKAVQRYFSDRPVWFIARSPTARYRMEVLAGPLPPENQDNKGQELTRVQQKNDAAPLGPSFEKNGGKQ